jgi:nicotinate-nucleotide adenylyltransferase
MKIGLLFGSFNPVHNGHLMIASQLMTSAECDEVWFVLSPQNPFKSESELLPFENRLILLNAAIRDETRFSVCDIEQSMPKPSYTIDTMRALKKMYPDTIFCIFGGTDILVSIDKWKESEELLKSFPFYIYSRQEIADNMIHHHNIQIVPSALLDISSTNIRSNIISGKSLKGMLPDSVNALIQHFNWYR